MSATLPSQNLPYSDFERQRSFSLGHIPLSVSSNAGDYLTNNSQASLDCLNQSSSHQSVQLANLVRKRLNEEIKLRIALIEKKKKDSLSLSIHLINFINDQFDNLYRHLNRHYEKLVSLLVKEDLCPDEINIVKRILSANYIPDKDYRTRCEKIISEAIISYKIRINTTTADYGETKEGIALKLELFVEGHKERINSIVLTDDQKYIVSGSEDATIRLWDLKSKCQEKTLIGHSMPVNSIATSADGNYLVSGSDDKTVRLWIFRKGPKLQYLPMQIL